LCDRGRLDHKDAGREVDFLVVLEGKRDFVQNDIRCVPARQLLGALA
jgi:hypothetical protein